MYVYHNSHDLRYRAPFGAIPSGESVKLSLTVKEHNDCRCTLRLWIEGVGERLVPMTSTYQDGGQQFTCTVEMPTDPTLVWYFFRIEDNGSVHFYGNHSGLGGEGALFDSEPPAYQITVYHPSVAPDWYTRGVVYQIFPDRFARGADWKTCWDNAAHPDDWNGPPRLLHQSWRDQPFYTKDTEGRVTRWDFFGGTLSGVEEKLLYLRSLGVTAIYLNPIFTASSCHRYDTADYMHVDPALGGDEAFASLAKAAKACNIRLILDGVFSHTGMDSIYFNRNGNYGKGGAVQDPDSPYRKWYRFTPDGYDCWWGVDDLPNVEELEPSYQAFIHAADDSVIRHWLKAGASGWRLDVADELPDAFIAGIRTAIHETTDEGLLIGEVWEDASSKESYGERRRYLLGDELDCTMNYPFRTVMTEFMLGKCSAETVRRKLRSLQENYPPSAFYAAMNLIGSHDRVRILTRMGDAPEGLSEQEQGAFHLDDGKRWLAIQRVKLLSLLQFTSPGVPCIYYGDEAGVEGYEDPYNRGPYPWGHENEELMRHYRDLTQLRQEHPVLIDGSFTPLSFGESVYGMLRENEDETILVLVNRDVFRTETIPYPAQAAAAIDLLTGHPLPIRDNTLSITLHPLGAVCVVLPRQAMLPLPLGRRAGILCPVFSLPGGKMGEGARSFLRYLKSAGQSIWQILPLNPVGMGNSPYSSPAIFAGDPRFIDPAEPVDESKYPAWLEANHEWVSDYALFMALHDYYDRPWQQWPRTARDRVNLSMLRKRHADAVAAYQHEQFVFWSQWDALHAYATSLGIEILGDAPIYVSEDSADLWAHPELFLLDEEGYPTLAAGCPPDYFSEDGQNWKNPLYNWQTMAQDDYAWWRARLTQTLSHLDWVRVDHFRAFSAYFAIPAGMQPRDGQWLKGPGLAFWRSMQRTLGDLRIVAEDLGDLDAGVYSLLSCAALPGMSVWQFHADAMRCMPQEQAAHRVFFTGTHDNQTLLGWLLDQNPDASEEDVRAIINELYASAGGWVILPIQDMLALDDSARVNRPGTVGDDNWNWQVDSKLLTSARAGWLRALAEQHHRY